MGGRSHKLRHCFRLSLAVKISKIFGRPNLHIIGAEINKFHTIFWLAMLLSANLSLPEEIFVHGLFTINGQKMSKTIGNVIDPIDLVEKFGADATRYLLCRNFQPRNMAM